MVFGALNFTEWVGAASGHWGFGHPPFTKEVLNLSGCKSRFSIKFNLKNKFYFRKQAADPCTRFPKKGNAKECSNYCTSALISHASKVMLKIFQARLQQYMNCELPDVQAGLRKGRGNRDQIANIRWIIKKAREFQKNTYFCFIDYTKAFDCVDPNKLWKIL